MIKNTVKGDIGMVILIKKLINFGGVPPNFKMVEPYFIDKKNTPAIKRENWYIK